MKIKYSSFDEYINNQPEKQKKALLELADCILDAAPNAIKIINYNIPAFALTEEGKRDQQIMIAAYKTHLGFYPHPTTIEYFFDKLSEFKKAKGSVQFPLSTPLPKELIIEMVTYRVKLINNQKS